MRFNHLTLKLIPSLSMLAAMVGLCSQTSIAQEKSDVTTPSSTLTAKLPQAVTNNAVAKVRLANNPYLLTFSGLGKDKDYQDVHNHAWALKLNDNKDWQPIDDVPFVAPLAGRLAASAVGIGQYAYFFGGYTVAQDHSEISTIDNYRFDLNTKQYIRIADMPVAVDDTTVAVYQDQYIYLFGGWHNTGNVNLVQVYDTKQNSWQQATPIPAPAVFGQTVAMVGNELVLCDGVKVSAQLNARRQYAPSPECLYGKINPENHLDIAWQKVPHFSQSVPNPPKEDAALYRMAGTGVMNTQTQKGQLIFIGGSDNPYNYNGIGYNGKPSEPSPWLFTFDLASHAWLPAKPMPVASMDHRGLICHQQQLYIIGGMLSQQQVSDKVLVTPLTSQQRCLDDASN